MDAVAVAAPRHFHTRVVVHQLEALHLRRLPRKTGEGDNRQDTQKYMFFHNNPYSFAK